MDNSILDSLMSAVGSQGIGDLAATLGQSQNGVSRGLQSTLATMLGALGSKTGDSGVMRQVFDLVSSAPPDNSVLSNITGLLGGAGGTTATLANLGGKLLPLLFGSQQAAATDRIAEYSGLTSSAVSGLMKVAGPLLLLFLHRRVAQDNLSPSSLATLLGRESASIRSFLPPGVAQLFSGGHSYVSPAVVETAASSNPSGRWLLPLVALLLLLGGLWWFLGRNRTHEVSERARTAVETTTDSIRQKLASGVELSYPKGSLEDRLVSYLNVSSTSAATEWFEFDRLLFNTNAATLQPSSQDQLRNVAEILKAYPKVKVKIGGYTDNTGDQAANRQLSQDRADSVMHELIAMGISPDRIRAEGYGADHPIADNATEAGRQQNRRVALRVTES